MGHLSIHVTHPSYLCAYIHVTDGRTDRLMEACAQRPSLHLYAVDVGGNTYSNGSKKATAVGAVLVVREGMWAC